MDAAEPLSQGRRRRHTRAASAAPLGNLNTIANTLFIEGPKMNPYLLGMWLGALGFMIITTYGSLFLLRKVKFPKTEYFQIIIANGISLVIYTLTEGYTNSDILGSSPYLEALTIGLTPQLVHLVITLSLDIRKAARSAPPPEPPKPPSISP